MYFDVTRFFQTHFCRIQDGGGAGRRPTAHLKTVEVTSANYCTYLNILKHINIQTAKQSLFKHKAEATGSSLSTVGRIVKQKDGHKTPEKKKPNKKEQFNKTNCSYILSKQQDFFTEKTTKQTERGNKILILNNYLKKLGFCYKKRERYQSSTKDQIWFHREKRFREESRKPEKMSLTEKLSTPMKLA